MKIGYKIILEDYGNDNKQEAFIEASYISNLQILREDDTKAIKVILNYNIPIIFKNCSEDFEVNIIKN